MSRRGAFTTASALTAVGCTAGVAAAGGNVAAAVWGALGAAGGIGFAYWGMRDWLRAGETPTSLPWFGWSSRRRATAAGVAVVLVLGSLALGPLVSWVLAITLVLIVVLGTWVAWLAIRS